QALAMHPRILLLDEAFSSLDPATRRDMQQLLRALWRSTGTTVIFVTHDPQEALRLASRVVVLAKDDPDGGSRVVLDVDVPDHDGEEDNRELIHRLERASAGAVSRPFRSTQVKRSLALAGVGVSMALTVLAAQAPAGPSVEPGPSRAPRPGVSAP